MRINWGIKIIILYLGFMALILTLVSMAMRQNVDLVSKDYYEQELKFQQKINKINQSRALKEPLAWEIKQGTLVLTFPTQFKGKKINGSIYFFRPSDASMDKTFVLPENSSTVFAIETNQLKSGVYKMQVNWEVEKTEYYNEGIIRIN